MGKKISPKAAKHRSTTKEKIKVAPAVSQKQQIAMSIAEHAPQKLYARNKGMKQMSKGQLHDFAGTKRSGLPKSKGKLFKR
jgi:hypothetical protein